MKILLILLYLLSFAYLPFAIWHVTTVRPRIEMRVTTPTIEPLPAASMLEMSPGQYAEENSQ